MNKNAGKLILVGALVVVAGAIYYFQGSSEPKLDDRIQYVDVSTGEMFWFDRGPTRLPRENPKTGQKTLMPCFKQEDGTIAVGSRHRETMEQLDKDGINKYVDPKTLVVRVEP